MGIERVRALEDFDAARARAFRRSLLGVLTRRAGRLRSIDAMLRAAGPDGRSYAGVHELPADQIAGSPGAHAARADFDERFLPAKRRLRDRWTRIYQAMVEGDELPPID